MTHRAAFLAKATLRLRLRRLLASQQAAQRHTRKWLAFSIGAACNSLAAKADRCSRYATSAGARWRTSSRSASSGITIGTVATFRSVILARATCSCTASRSGAGPACSRLTWRMACATGPKVAASAWSGTRCRRPSWRSWSVSSLLARFGRGAMKLQRQLARRWA